MSKLKVLFLCTGNSCRSQIAEAWLRHYGSDQFEAFSAGVDPKPIHPLTIQVMEEAGIDMSTHRSKDLREYLGWQHLGCIVVVCSEAGQHCPTAWPGVKARIAMLFDDPAAFEGSEAEKLACFRRVRDEIEQGVLGFIREHAAAAGTAGAA